MIKLSTEIADRMAEAAALAIDDGSGGSAIVRIYDGTRPANLDEAITTQNVIAEISLPEGSPFVFRETTDSFVAYELSTSEPVFVTLAGEASFFRLFDNEGNATMDGDVSNPAGTGDMKISMVEVSDGFLVKIISFVYKIAKTP